MGLEKKKKKENEKLFHMFTDMPVTKESYKILDI